MPVYSLTEEAEADFDSIGDYTLETWGAAQVLTYLSKLDQCFHKLAADRSAGRMRPELQPDLWSLKCGHHLIYFRRDASGNVAVLRVLHERMDSDRYL